jgi:SAM-dependent methyltransferase
MRNVARQAAHAVDPASRLAFRLRHKGTGAIPPNALRARVGSPGVGWPSIRSYLTHGRQAACDVERILTHLGRPFFSDWQSVLDFGCGSGRVLRWLLPRRAANQQVEGCDVDAAAINWAAANFPEAHWTVSPYEPPLHYPADAFELLYSVSVFSHFDSRLEALWLREIHRILRPGGKALLSTHGEYAWESMKRGDIRHPILGDEIREYDKLGDGAIFLPYYATEAQTPGIGTGFGAAFHSEDHIRREWGAIFGAVEILPRAFNGWQDVAVVTR